jgi:hypothetical protein
MHHRHEDSDDECECEPNGSFWSYFGQGLAILLICLGIGGRTWLEKHNGPLVIIRHERTN